MADNVFELPDKTDKTDKTDNVIKFPQKNNNMEIPTTEEELEDSVGKIKNMFFEMVSLELGTPIFNRASLHGFDVSDDTCIKDCILVVETIKSLLLKSKGIYHEIQDYAEQNIDYTEDDMIYAENEMNYSDEDFED